MLQGWARKTAKEYEESVAELTLSIDGGEPEKILMPTAFASRKHELGWKYQLPEGKHMVEIQLLNASPAFRVDVGDVIVYSSSKP